MEMAGSSSVLDVSTPTYDLKFMMASNIKVSNFVSVKLSGHNNYKIWKAQMLCLLESQVLLHMVNAERTFPVDKGIHMQYDKLVKGWFFGSVNEKVLKDLVDLDTAKNVWEKLESLFNPSVSDSEGHSSNAPDVSALDVIAPVVSAMREDLKYIQASTVDVSNFVSEKLVGRSNYYIWKTEMLNLIGSHDLLPIIHDKPRFPGAEGDPMTQKYDSLVRGWILNTMNDNRRDGFRMYRSVQLMWKKLESTFTYQPEMSDSDIEDTDDDSSSETEDSNYMQLKSNIVNVSSFVSVRLSGRNNYNIWKDQMLRLLQSHNLLHIIEGFPLDEDDPMTKKYGNLVRGWILSTMNDEERHKYRIYRSVKLMWGSIESTFDETEDLKYMEASNVNVSNFVLVNLSNVSNYSIWRAQMLYLLENHSLLHIINDRYSFEPDKYDNLVKGWIFCTMNDELLKEFPAEDYVNELAKNLWEKLESCLTSSYSRPEPVDSASTQDLKYTQALNVNVSNFVSVKLSGRSNYSIWKDQMLFLIESQKLLHIIEKKDGFTYIVDKYEPLVKGWIFSTITEQLLKDLTYKQRFFMSYYAITVWKELKSAFSQPTSDTDREDPQELTFGIEFIEEETEFVSDLPELDNTDEKRSYKAAVEGCCRKAKSIFKINKNIPTEATTANDNTILHVADETKSSGTEVVRDIPDIETECSGKEVVRDTPNIETESSRIESIKKELYVAGAKGWWKKAKSIFKINKNVATEAITTDIESVKKLLYKAAAEGSWRKAKSILINSKIAATEAIATNGNTILHVAVEMGHNHFVEELLEFLENGEDIEKKNERGRTALHIAAMVGNTHAAQLLARKRKNMLEIEDDNDKSPLDLASEYMNLNIYAYLLKSLTPSNLEVRSFWSERSAILAAIFSKQYDFVEKLLKTITFDLDVGEEILMAMTITFPTDLGFMESFIYPCICLTFKRKNCKHHIHNKIISLILYVYVVAFHNVRHKTVVRGSLLFNPDRCVDDILQVVNLCNNTCCSWLGKNSMILLVLTTTFYPIYQLICLLILMLHLSFSMLYLLFWKVLAITMQPIKNIEKKKKEYKEAKKLFKMVCKKMGPSRLHYSLFEAIRLDIYDIVDEILFTSPATINCKDEDGYNIFQSSILNRAEKVYNLIYHIIERTKSQREMIDYSSNNLSHLAGRLAPSFVLSRTTGAALQLQRELLWFEEVKKLVLPLQLTKKNIFNETPAMVFTREHQDLLRQGEIWMKTTAESCSITVALIVTVVFAAAITVPGGNNQESGIPLFKKEMSFTIFAISNAFSLFTGATSLLLFLSILTARSSEKDFLVSLPRRLIFGLLTLFLSTIAMMVAFGAILFLVFCDQRAWMLAPICAFACLPISVIVTIKLPLLVDLIQSTYSPNFGKQRYIETCKVNQKNTIIIK